MQASDVARSGRYGCCSSESHDGSAGRPHDSGGSRDARSAGAVTEIIIAGGPVRTDVPGQWRILLNETPSAAWRDRLLELAAADPVTAAFRIEVEGTILPGGFSCLRRFGSLASGRGCGRGVAALFGRPTRGPLAPFLLPGLALRSLWPFLRVKCALCQFSAIPDSVGVFFEGLRFLDDFGSEVEARPLGV